MFYSDDKKQYSVLNRRTFLLYFLKIFFFGIVGWRLYNIQIKDSQKYKTLSKNNQIDIEIIYPVRGKIYDINNNVLASNVQVFDVYLIPENTKDIKKISTRNIRKMLEKSIQNEDYELAARLRDELDFRKKV